MFYKDPADCLSLLPEMMQGIVEIDEIEEAVNIQLDKLSAAIKKAVDNKFPSSCDADGCARWEKILAISQVIDQFKNTSITGDPAVVNDLLAPATTLKMHVTGQTVQDGTGDKSPDNPYMLAGVTKLTISDGGSNSQTIALPQPLYSLPDGTADDYDAVSGQGAAKEIRIVSDGNEAWDIRTDKTNLVNTVCFQRYDIGGTRDLICSHFKNLSGDSDSEHCRNGGPNYPNIFLVFISKSRLAGWSDSWTNGQKIAAFKVWLAANPVTVLYELATPQAISGEAQTINAYAPTTVILADSGQISATIRSYDPDATLQARRDAIRSKIMTKPPINLQTLKSIVEAYMGLPVNITLDGYRVHIKYRGESRVADLNPLYATMWTTIPANMLVDIAYLYATWGEVKAVYPTWGDVKAKTWEQIHKGV